MGDLEGLTVVSVEQAVAAPYASCMLADAGARVIKVERPEGDFARNYDRDVLGQSAYFVWLNRGKESICVNLEAEVDRAFLRQIALRADVFIQNLKPGALHRLGLGSTQLRAEAPGLITCDISGFGGSGPLSSRKAYDLIVQAEVGLCAISGTVNRPVRVGISVCDIAAGATAHAAILQALLAKSRTGRGRSIEVSLFDSIAQWMAVPLLQYFYAGRTPPPAEVAHPSIAPYGVFSCQGGDRVILSVQNEREWLAFAEHILDCKDLASDSRFSTNTLRVANRAMLDEIIASRLASLSYVNLAKQLDEADIAFGQLNDLPGAAAHAHLRQVNVSTPSGDVRVVAPAAIVLDGTPHFRPVPNLGEHTLAIRKEFK
jgi:crotonobetainyl-CoA:carnitine CoA-transferase CaiB-like acyl-CoA transferase